ncbi:MAG: hypothetical protein VKL42_17950 [Snowella sp.]|nr:hypothetical protein [Snowella sp.]
MKTGFLLTVNGLTQKPFEPFLMPLSEPLSWAIAVFKRVISEILSFRDLIEIVLGLFIVMLLDWQIGIVTITLIIGLPVYPNLNGHQQIILISHMAMIFSLVLILLLI